MDVVALVREAQLAIYSPWQPSWMNTYQDNSNRIPPLLPMQFPLEPPACPYRVSVDQACKGSIPNLHSWAIGPIPRLQLVPHQAGSTGDMSRTSAHSPPWLGQDCHRGIYGKKKVACPRHYAQPFDIL